MTRKDYKLIASAIADAVAAISPETKSIYGEHLAAQHRIRGIQFAMTKLCAKLAKDNPRFQPEKFLAACGLEA